jgi:transposase-like protein
MVSKFPRTLPEFEQRFASEAACREYLVQMRWPDGFRCPRCGHGRCWTNRRHLLVCRQCQHQSSLTAGTILHGSRKPLRTWFLAMWWISTQKTGGSAKGLQRLLGLGSYQTAWMWLHKLRHAMVRLEREPLEGPVEIDDAYFGGVERETSTTTKAKVLVAVEVPGGERSRAGRVRFQVVKRFTRPTLIRFVRDYVAPGAVVITDGLPSYALVTRHGFGHEPRVVGSDRRQASRLLPYTNRVISLAKRWLLGTHQGRVSHKHLQPYLEEFAFRFNRRKSRHVGWLFNRMLEQSLQAEPHTYRDVVHP